MIGRAIANIVAIGFVAAFACDIVLAFRYWLKIVAARKDGVSLPEAMIGTNILFKPRLYKPEAQDLVNRLTWSMIRAPLFFLAAVGLFLFGQWLAGEPIGLQHHG